MTKLKTIFSLALCGALSLGSFVSCNNSQISGSSTDGGATGDGASAGDGPGTGGGLDSGSGGYGDGGLAAYCSGSGPPISLSDPGGTSTTCNGDLAATVFRYGLCVCNSFSTGAAVNVDAVDSSGAAVPVGGTGGSVGVNTNVNFSSMSVGGTFQVAGSMVVNQTVSTGADLLLSSGLNSISNVTVGRDAQINGNIIENGGVFKVVRTLTQPGGFTLNAPSTSIGSTVRAAVNVGPPCDCAASQIYPIAGYVTARQSSNDNAAIGLDPMVLSNFAGDQSMSFNCGRFYLNGIGGSGRLNLNVSGRTALFVGSNINLNNGLTVNLGTAGELDLFVNGGLNISAGSVIGDPAHPSRLRIYMGGNGNINLAAGVTIYGNIYGPQSALVTSGALTVTGAIFAGSFNASAVVTIHHDLDVLRAAKACNMPTGTNGNPPPPPPTCSRCQDCGGQACKAGSCGACTANSDCCAPLSCSQGQCVYVAG